MIKDKLIKYFNKNLKEMLSSVSPEIFENAEEIRIRLYKGIMIKANEKEYVCLTNKGIIEYKNIKNNDIYLPTPEDFKQTLELMSNYSIYAFEQEFKNGFITLQGGFRVGISGKVIFENNEIKTIRNISSLNIRIAREIKGCSKKVMPYVVEKDNVKNTMIISPPNCGKTTLLRDLILNISNLGFNVGVVDERSEISGGYRGLSQMDLGFRTDVLDSCPKADGMILLLRSMAPSVIAVDEIGTERDVKAIESVSNSGVKLICSIHSENLEEFKNKPIIKTILQNNIFERFIFLDRSNGIGTISEIYNKNFEKIKINFYTGG